MGREFLVNLLNFSNIISEQFEKIWSIILEICSMLSLYKDYEEDIHFLLLKDGWEGLLKYINKQLLNKETILKCKNVILSSIQTWKKSSNMTQFYVNEVEDIILSTHINIFNFPDIVKT
jgi:hypothetical protein